MSKRHSTICTARRLLALAAILSFVEVAAVLAPLEAQSAPPTRPDASARTVRAFRDAQGVIAIQQLVGMPVQFVMDFGTRRAGALMPAAGDSLQLVYIEAGARIPSPEYMALNTRSDVATLRVTAGKTVRTPREVPLFEEEMTVSNGAVTLSGRFIRPAAPGKYPVVLFLHGSGAATRQSFPSWGALLATQGIASFAFDKRGTGGSTGDWQASTLADLAADGTAIVTALRARADVVPAKVALIGTSQGPWVATMMAAADPTIAALVFSSGGGVSGATQEIYRRVHLAKDSGATAQEEQLARDIVTRYFRYLASGGSDSVGISGFWSSYGTKPWFRALSMPRADPTVGEWPEGRKVFGRDLAIDYVALHRRIHQPVLQLLSAADEAVPAQLASETLRDQLPNGRGGQLESIIYNDSDHRFQTPAKDGDIPLFHQEYFPKMLSWLTAQLLGRPVRP